MGRDQVSLLVESSQGIHNNSKHTMTTDDGSSTIASQEASGSLNESVASAQHSSPSTSRATTATRRGDTSPKGCFKSIPKRLITKLSFDSLKELSGRDRESAVLHQCYIRLNTEGNTGRELILIQGSSGTGTTTLAKHFAVNLNKGCYVRGTFRSSNCDSPYSGIMEACSQICQEIQRRRNSGSDSESFYNMRQAILEALHTKLHLLSNIVPEMLDMIHEEEMEEFQVRSQRVLFPTLNRSTSADQIGNDEAKQLQLKYAFRVLIRIVLFSCL